MNSPRGKNWSRDGRIEKDRLRLDNNGRDARGNQKNLGGGGGGGVAVGPWSCEGLGAENEWTAEQAAVMRGMKSLERNGWLKKKRPCSELKICCSSAVEGKKKGEEVALHSGMHSR